MYLNLLIPNFDGSMLKSAPGVMKNCDFLPANGNAISKSESGQLYLFIVMCKCLIYIGLTAKFIFICVNYFI